MRQDRCEDRFGCHRWADDNSGVGIMLLEKCNYACYPIGSQRWHAEIARTTTFRNTADTESDLFDGSGETTVAPLDSELYAQVKAAVTADV